MSDLGYGREIGEGLRRMDRELETAGFAPAVLRGGGNSVVVTLLFESVWQKVMALASADAGRFVDHLRQHDRVTAAEAEDLLGVSRPTSNSFLKRLVAAKVLERIASSPYDRNVHWIVRRGAQSGGSPKVARGQHQTSAKVRVPGTSSTPATHRATPRSRG